MSLIVLMSTYNGEKYLKEQLNSLVSQSLLPDKILIRDDGSSDSTLDILKYYSDMYNFIEYYQGENLKPAKSFWELINKAEGYDYIALCDQDDVWYKDKLEVAVKRLKYEHDKDIPLLYACNYQMVDKDLNKIEEERSRLYSYTDFPHALLYQTAPGCTMVFNSYAREKIIQYDMNKEFCIIHDSIIHKVVTCFGKFIYDNEPHIYYRQHGDNQIGMSKTKSEQFLSRIKRFISGTNKNYRSKTAISLLRTYGNELDNHKKHLINIIAFYKDNTDFKYELMTRDEFKVEGINNFLFKILVLLNYI